ncbi:exodeoxyribonuclease V subunit alpha [Dokdonella sp.]|uniref:exodeoxyribonuclease V subunit alpha n=1 Tax=Dokdonella sp. TaxID=2291710 RepID=UPI003784A0D3
MNTYVAGQQFDFRERPSHTALPEEWRELDRAVWRWVRAHGGDEATAHAAAWASHAEGQGHSALPLSMTVNNGDPALAAKLRTTLARSTLVADVGKEQEGPRPFVLEGEHFYLMRNHRAEVAVARELARRRGASVPARCPLSDDELRGLFNGSWSDAEERQRAAVRQAIGRRLMVLTGGPGTGKTTTVLRMLLGLSREHHAQTGRLPQLRIAAPTGKAAQRLSESLRNGAMRLRGAAQPVGEAWIAHLDAVLGAESGTVHRLLGSRGRNGGYAFHADEPLPADMVVVDEASMLDLGLLRALLDALRDDAALVLVGDADQLTSVGTGSIMMDIVQALDADPREDLVRLVHCFRADVTLVPINEAVRAGDPAAFASAMESAAAHTASNGRCAAVSKLVADLPSLRRQLTAWTRNLQGVLEDANITTAVAATDVSLAVRLDALRRQQLLCALREGPFGAVQVATAIAARLRNWDALSPWAGSPWYPGRAVIITRSDHAARLYNGDVGLCVLVESANDQPVLQVAFEPTPDASAESVDSGASARVRLFDPGTLPPHEDAFALTVHKSQGSEYDHVAVLLPPDAESPLLVRQTLYTGLSRARRSLELWSVPAATDKAIGTVLRRHGRLAQRVLDEAGSGLDGP